MDDSLKWLTGSIAIALGLFGYVPYLRDMAKGRTKPHAFSWLVWALLTGIGFAAQISDGGGAGAWATGVTAGMATLIFVFAIFRGEKEITSSDWLSLVFSISAIPLWLITKSPFWAVVLVTLVDAVAFFPTIRKSFLHPDEETSVTYLLSAVKFSLSLLALQNYSTVTVLYPASLVVMNAAFVLMLALRRHAIKKLAISL